MAQNIKVSGLFTGNENFGSSARMKVFRFIIILFTSIYLLQLAYLQIIRGSLFRSESEAQAIKKMPIEPFRGNLFDRNRELIVHNKPSFSITITPYLFKSECIPLLLSIIPVDSTLLLEIATDAKKFPRFTPIKIYRDLNYEETAKIEEYSDFLNGVDVIVESKRKYEFECNMAHLLGYTREVTPDQIKKFSYLKPGDVIGQTGLEYTYDRIVRGEPGYQYIAVTNNGKRVYSFDQKKIRTPANNGSDLQLGLDLHLQELAEKLLEGKRGAAVALDPSTGEIIIFASKPDYDPREFSGKVPTALFEKLNNDDGKPLLNRALMSQYPPGSTWKMLMAAAALQEGLITENTIMYCPGSFTFAGRSYKCHSAHGQVNVKKAIHVSCNVFFYQIGLKLGMERFEKYGDMFGFGRKTYIDLPNEASGRLPTVEWLSTQHDKYSQGKLVNYGIGQGEILVTPLQMAVYAATIANKGIVVQPHVVSNVLNNLTNKTESIFYAKKELPVDKKIFEIIQSGMFDVVNTPGGTASAAKLPDIVVCGKTGTAQNPHGQDHSWFICFAPRDNPKIAMAVFVENAGFGGAISAPIAHDLLNGFFHPGTLKQQLAETKKKAAPADTLKPNLEEVEPE
ncbi:MAG: penicillin-binding protein 2 [Candidatus Kapabacteria bacterium]|nr:penicillin-binding protein 2 [Candidatus Kapabacteria bacterium]